MSDRSKRPVIENYSFVRAAWTGEWKKILVQHMVEYYAILYSSLRDYETILPIL
jgi:hypothetical protein